MLPLASINMKFFKTQKGFTLLEVVVALGLLIMVFGGVTGLAIMLSEAGRSTRNNLIASNLAQEAENLLRYKRDLNYILVVSPFTDIAIETDNTAYYFTLNYDGTAAPEASASVQSATPLQIVSNQYAQGSGTVTKFRRLITTTYHIAAGPSPAYLDVKIEVYWNEDTKNNTYTLYSELSDWRATSGDCTGSNVEGDVCGGGTVVDATNHIVAVTGGCTDSSGGGCGTGDDSLTKVWDTGDTPGTTGATDTDDGRNNATTLNPSVNNQYEAVKFCNDFSYLGYTNWYLPAQNELDQLETANTNTWSTGYFECGSYWSSTETASNTAYEHIVKPSIMMICAPGSYDKTSPLYVRCVRRY